MRGKNSILSSILTVVLFFLIVIALFGALFKFTNIGVKISDMINPAFRIEFNGVTYTGNDNEITLPKDCKAKFEVKGTKGYKLSITPNVTDETDFTYTVNGQTYAYGNEDLTGLIVDNSDIYAKCFYIDCTHSYLIEDLLSRIWIGSEVTINTEEIISYPYLMKITSDSGEEISIALGHFIHVADIDFPYADFIV